MCTVAMPPAPIAPPTSASAPCWSSSVRSTQNGSSGQSTAGSSRFGSLRVRVRIESMRRRSSSRTEGASSIVTATADGGGGGASCAMGSTAGGPNEMNGVALAAGATGAGEALARRESRLRSDIVQ